jgi:hypothetical protein
MNAVFGNDIVKLDVADLEVGPTAGRHRWFPFKIAAVGLIAAAFITLMLKPNDTRDCFWSATINSCNWVHP